MPKVTKPSGQVKCYINPITKNAVRGDTRTGKKVAKLLFKGRASSTTTKSGKKIKKRKPRKKRASKSKK